MKSLEVSLVNTSAIPVGRLYTHQRQIHFEYNAEFLDCGFALSPYQLPLKSGIHKDTIGLWQGLQGVFNDSLPDGWGLLLMDRQFRQAGVDPYKITPLDRLAWLGDRTMGALSYQPVTGPANDPLLIELPEMAKNAQQIFAGTIDTVLPELFRAGGSPGGARPKALVATKDDKIITADGKIPTGYTPWLVKFNAKDDFPDAGNIEYAYSLMAKDAGLEMPKTQLMEGTFFAAQRFDRAADMRGHVHTLGNMIGADFRIPALDYMDICKVVFDVTKSQQELLKILRQMIFNIATHNRDDHSKNFAFIWNQATNSWQLSPAYDLMFSTGIHGEHTSTIAGEGKSPSKEDIISVAKKFSLERQALAMIEQINDVVSMHSHYFNLANVSKKSQEQLASYIKAIC